MREPQIRTRRADYSAAVVSNLCLPGKWTEVMPFPLPVTPTRRAGQPLCTRQTIRSPTSPVWVVGGLENTRTSQTRNTHTLFGALGGKLLPGLLLLILLGSLRSAHLELLLVFPFLSFSLFLVFLGQLSLRAGRRRGGHAVWASL